MNGSTETTKEPGSWQEALRFLAAWLVLSAAASLSAVVLVHGFNFVIQRLTSFLLGISELLPLWSALGALFVGAAVYRVSPASSGEGIPSYIAGMTGGQGRLPFKATVFKLLASMGTLGFFSPGGLIGPLGRTNAGILSTAA
ncbi:MAG: chloride channel protein, partial [Spirochaetales bacterium]|nr:chloride channel protein [Spirochaetales bacterium]